MTDLVALSAIFAAMALGQSLLAAGVLIGRKDPSRIYMPLIAFFTANAITEFTTLTDLIPVPPGPSTWQQASEIVSMLAFLVLAPAFWFYIKAITSETRYRPAGRDLIHTIPFGFGLLIGIIFLFAPPDARWQILGDGDGPATRHIIFITALFIALFVIWSAQAGLYAVAGFRRLMQYRSRLKDLYASTEGRELTWIRWVVGLLSLNIALIIFDMFFGTGPVIDIITDGLDLLLIWVLAVWGLRQMPGLMAETETLEPAEKYERSALTQDDMKRIAAKIETAMHTDKLYLEPSLSLRRLSKHISVTPNYVSQTLNAYIGSTFFDYVNGFRIKSSIPVLLRAEEPILNIAYDAGFNSRSSFYKAFKRETGKTPSEYRAHSKTQV